MNPTEEARSNTFADPDDVMKLLDGELVIQARLARPAEAFNDTAGGVSQIREVYFDSFALTENSTLLSGMPFLAKVPMKAQSTTRSFKIGFTWELPGDESTLLIQTDHSQVIVPESWRLAKLAADARALNILRNEYGNYRVLVQPVPYLGEDPEAEKFQTWYTVSLHVIGLRSSWEEESANVTPKNEAEIQTLNLLRDIKRQYEAQ